MNTCASSTAARWELDACPPLLLKLVAAFSAALASATAWYVILSTSGVLPAYTSWFLTGRSKALPALLVLLLVFVADIA